MEVAASVFAGLLKSKRKINSKLNLQLTLMNGGGRIMNEYVIRLNSKKKNIKILNDDIIEVDGREIKFSITETTDSKYILKIDNKILKHQCWI